MQKKIHYFILFLLSLLLISCEEQSVKKLPSPKPTVKVNVIAPFIKIGVIAPFSGSNDSKGIHGLEGIKTAMYYHGDFANGAKIKLIIEDDKDKPELAIQALKKLVEKDKVSAILILSSSKAVLAINKLADQYKTPILALIASHHDIALNNDYVSQLCFDNNFQGKVAALFARDELLINKVAIFEDTNSFHSTSLAAVFKQKFISIGGEITDVVAISSKVEDLPAVLQKLKEHETELLYLPVAAKDVIKISKTLEDIDWAPLRIGSDGLLATVFAKHQVALPLMEGIIAIDLYTSTSVLTDYSKKLEEVYKQLFNNTSSTYTAAGAEGYSVLFDAIKRCQDFTDRESINKNIHKTDFKGFMGRITIDRTGKAQRPLIVNTIRNEQLLFMVKVH